MRASEEVVAYQQNFRTLLKAMSRPGSIHRLNITDSEPVVSVAQILIDREVAFCVKGDINLAEKILDVTRSPLAGIEAADFVIFADGNSRGDIHLVKRGTLEYPDRSATVIYRVEALCREGNGNGAPRVLLTGPGIESESRPTVKGLAQGEFEALREVNAEFPLGVDCIFTDTTGRLMCIPRSTRIEVIR